MNVSLDLNIWIAVTLTLAVFSFLYKDNPLYRFAESARLLLGCLIWAKAIFLIKIF